MEVFLPILFIVGLIVAGALLVYAFWPDPGARSSPQPDRQHPRETEAPATDPSPAPADRAAAREPAPPPSLHRAMTRPRVPPPEADTDLTRELLGTESTDIHRPDEDTNIRSVAASILAKQMETEGLQLFKEDSRHGEEGDSRAS